MYQFARAAITKYHRLSALNNRNLFSRSSGGQKSELKVSEGLVPSEGVRKDPVPCFFSSCWCRQSLAFLGLLLHHPNIFFHLHMAYSFVHVSSQGIFKIRMQVMLDQEPTVLQCDLILTKYICNYSISKQGHILGYRGLEFQHIFFVGRHNSNCNRWFLGSVILAFLSFSLANDSIADQCLLALDQGF